MARLLCLCLVSLGVSAGAFEDAHAFVQSPVLEHLVSGGASVLEKLTSIANAPRKEVAMELVKELRKVVAKEYGADLLKFLQGGGLLNMDENDQGRDESDGSRNDQDIPGVVAAWVKKLFPNGGGEKMRLALNYATAGEKAEEVGLKMASKGCATDTECNIEEGDAVELSTKKDFSFALGSNDIVSVEMHLKFDDVPMMLQSLEAAHPERIFRFECPACGAKCKLSLDKSFPGLKMFIPTFSQTFGNKLASMIGVNATEAMLDVFTQEREVTMPDCPQIVRPFADGSLSAVWKPPELWQPIMLTAARAVKVSLASKVDFKHSDGSLIWGLTSAAKLG